MGNTDFSAMHLTLKKIYPFHDISFKDTFQMCSVATHKPQRAHAPLLPLLPLDKRSKYKHVFVLLFVCVVVFIGYLF
jgi:hypothetical protein